MTDDAVREIHGVSGRYEGKRKTVAFREGDEAIIFDDSYYAGTSINPWQARYLAAKLYRLSRRIRARQDALAASANGEG